MKARLAVLAVSAVAALTVVGVASADVEKLPGPHASWGSVVRHPSQATWNGLQRPHASWGSRFHAHQAIYPAPTPV